MPKYTNKHIFDQFISNIKENSFSGVHLTLSITQHFKGRKGEKLDQTYYCFKTNSKTY